MAKQSKICVNGLLISIQTVNKEDYFCLTDMVKAKDGDFFVSDWLRNANTLDFLSAWEGINNGQNFNYGEFAIIRNNAGSNNYKISAKEWVEKTNSVGVYAISGRYGGTYAHKDIAFQFGMWISPKFQLFIIKEYQKLKEAESNQYNIEWDIKRFLSKTNYNIHTGAIRDYIIPKSNYTKDSEWLAYADEADMLNVIIFGCTAKEWRDVNMDKHLSGENMRDSASIIELIVLTNLESLNSVLITNGAAKGDRFRILKKTAQEQKESLEKIDSIKSIKKISNTTFVDVQKDENLLEKKG